MKHLDKVLVFLAAFLLYAGTFSHEFALDDKIVISHNQFTKKGFDGISDIFTHDAFTGFFGKQKNLVEGGRYRPLTLAYFAVVWEFLGPREGLPTAKYNKKKENLAHVLHISNALFYGLTAILLLITLQQLFTSTQKFYLTPAFLMTLLYLAHPLHTEVVANIKSLDEIWSLLGGLGALYFCIRSVDTKNQKLLIWAFLSFLFGVFAKETVVTFLGVIPLTLYVFRSEMRIPEIVKNTLPMLGAFLIYFFIRSQVLGEISTSGQEQLLNQPFLKASASEKLATIFFCMFWYLKLLIFPHPLTHDYYPWHPIGSEDFVYNGKDFPYVDFSSAFVWMAIGIYLLMLAFGVYKLLKDRTNIWGYLALFFIGTFILFTNLFFEIGVFMNERFMYVPSIAFAIATVLILNKWLKKQAVIIALILFGFYSFKTISRASVWKNDHTLAIADYKTSSASAKVNMSVGGAFYEKARKEKNATKKNEYLLKATNALQKSLRLYPHYIQSKTLLGHTLYEAQNFQGSRNAYESGLKQNPNFKDIENAIFFIADTLVKANNPQEAVKYLEMLSSLLPKNHRAFDELGEVYGKNLQNLPKAIENLLKAHALQPENLHTLENLGVAYGFSGDFKTSLKYFLKAEQIEPGKKTLLENIGKTYFYLGDKLSSDRYMQKATSL